MRVIIVEDEQSATKNMIAMLNEIDPNISVIACIQSISEAKKWIKNNPSPELAFFDIQLADGLSFEIFDKGLVGFPIIFTTAFNQYALRAFKVNSIDYLLKPIKKQELIFAIDKHKKINPNVAIKNEKLNSVVTDLKLRKTFKETILIKKFNGLRPIKISEFSYFVKQNGILYGVTNSEEKFILDETLDSLEEQLPPSDFFRANRQFIVSRISIKEVKHYFNRRLTLKLHQSLKTPIIISKARVSLFTNWLRQ